MIWRSVFESFCLLRRESRLKVKKEKQPRIFGSTGLVSVFCFVICPRQEGLASDLAAHRLNGAQAAQNVFTGLVRALIRQKDRFASLSPCRFSVFSPVSFDPFSKEADEKGIGLLLLGSLRFRSFSSGRSECL
jgi:hypothetical protein